MTTQEIADRLTELCRKGDFETAIKELFAEDAISIEPEASHREPTKGLNAILEKGKQFDAMVEEVHSSRISDPIVGGNAIAFSLNMDVTLKGVGHSAMSEICVYEVKDGKIISERFFS